MEAPFPRSIGSPAYAKLAPRSANEDEARQKRIVFHVFIETPIFPFIHVPLVMLNRSRIAHAENVAVEQMAHVRAVNNEDKF
jgi:hypothetical protein